MKLCTKSSFTLDGYIIMWLRSEKKSKRKLSFKTRKVTKKLWPIKSRTSVLEVGNNESEEEPVAVVEAEQVCVCVILFVCLSSLEWQIKM